MSNLLSRVFGSGYLPKQKLQETDWDLLEDKYRLYPDFKKALKLLDDKLPLPFMECVDVVMDNFDPEGQLASNYIQGQTYLNGLLYKIPDGQIETINEFLGNLIEMD